MRDASPATESPPTGGGDTHPLPVAAPFLTARALAARGRAGPAFTGIDLAADLGRLVAVTGDAGDGRTALLLALSGRYATTAGTLVVDGKRRRSSIRKRFTVAQAAPAVAFDPHHTVAACIAETVAVSGRAATDHNIHAWLARLAVDVDSRDAFGLLPRIEQARFAIACAAAARTPAVVVDDADAGLNNAGGARVFEALRTVADAGQLVIAASARHDLNVDILLELRGNRVLNGGRR